MSVLTSPFPNHRLAVRELQFAKLRKLVAEVEGRNPFWTHRLREAGLVAEALRGIDDLSRLPILRKSDLANDQRESPPYGTNLTFPAGDYSRLHQTSGTTTGQPMRWLDTPRSWEWILSCWRQLYALLGLRADDRLCFTFSFGPFIGFWAGFEGAAQMGNLCLATGGMSSEARLKMILDNQVTLVACTPTYALRLAETAGKLGVDLQDSAVRGILVAGEPGGNIPAIRQQIEATWNARVFDHWGMTELGPMAIEAEGTPGSLTMLETECIVEVVNPETGIPVADGETGELVMTNLGRTGSPLLRYGTGDLVRMVLPVPGDPPFVRLEGGILSRADDMLIIRGNNVFPSSVEAIIREWPEFTEFRMTVVKHREMQQLSLELEPADDCSDSQAETAGRAVRRAIKERLNFDPETQIVARGTLPRFDMKAKRVVRRDREEEASPNGL